MSSDDDRGRLGRRVWRALSGTPETLGHAASPTVPATPAPGPPATPAYGTAPGPAWGTPPGERSGGARPVGPRLTAADVRSVLFTVAKFREGYAIAEVDALLDRVAETLDRHGVPSMHPDDVGRARFRATKLRAGYDQDEVDAFLDLVVAELRHRHAAR